MILRLGITSVKKYEIIIESHTDAFAYWAELLAAKLGAQHFFFCTNENYRPSAMEASLFFADNLDFFYFKWKRNEVVGGEKVLQKLFNGYKNVTKPQVEMPDTVREMDPIQDVAFSIEEVPRLDWNICHVGRAAKDYVPFVIEGVGELARRHPDKKINFIMVGDAQSRIPLFQQTFADLPNVFCTFFGDMVPIPRVLFSKVDVACAISQSARFVANEGIPTIVATVKNHARTPGLLGYDTKEQVYGEGTFSYVDALENVLIKKLYVGKKYGLPKLKPPEKYYDNFWKIVKNASPVKEYYVERLSQERIRNWTAIFPFGAVARDARIIFFGETEITKDYRKQIINQQIFGTEFGRGYVKTFKPQPYCEIVATVDERPEEFDDTVVGFERLKAQDYDAIVVCVYPQQFQAAQAMILQIVPDMANRIIYSFQLLFT